MSPQSESSAIASVEEIVEEIRAGRMVVLVDDEDRENEGDIILAADHVTPEAINFMVTHARGLVCLTITEARAHQLGLAQMAHHNTSPNGTAFTMSIEAAEGVTTGISAQDRARTVQAAVARNAKPSDFVMPGHTFPIVAREGGVLVRAGHTEAGCDLAQLAGLEPASVICEVLKDDGTMARLPDLIKFAQEHGIKIGTIADLIHYRSQTASIVERIAERDMQTMQGLFRAIAFRDKPSGGAHLALVHGDLRPDSEVLVRVHQPLSIVDLLETQLSSHSWSVSSAMAAIKHAGAGALLLLNCEESPGDVFESFISLDKPKAPIPARLASQDLRNYGIGAQILRDIGVGKMRLLANPRRMPSMTGFDLDVVGFMEKPGHL